MNQAEQKIDKIRIEKLEKRIERMKLMVTKLGFFNLYQQNITSQSSKIDVFNKLNEEYHELFGEYRYADFNSFKNQYYKIMKK